MAITSDQIAKGDAIQKLIDLLAQVKKDSDLKDEEIIALFQTDELTDLQAGAYLDMLASGKPDLFEPGHKYRIIKDGTPQYIVTATSTAELSPVFEIIGEPGNRGIFISIPQNSPKDSLEELLKTGLGHGYRIIANDTHPQLYMTMGASPESTEQIATLRDINTAVGNITEITAAEVQAMFTA